MGMKSQSVLAVDDDVRTLDRISMILDSSYAVLATSDSKRALTLLQNDKSITAVVVGQNLKGCNAWNCSRWPKSCVQMPEEFL